MQTWGKKFHIIWTPFRWSVNNLVVTLFLYSLDYIKSCHPILFEIIGNHVFMINDLILFSCSIFGFLIAPFIFHLGSLYF